jgi:hypothetical protein
VSRYYECEWEEYQRRYGTEGEAQAGHAALVERVKESA